MGDNGKLYVPEEVVPVYRDELLPLASVITPNQFEAEILTGIKIAAEEHIYDACDRLHRIGVPVVVITSVQVPMPDGRYRYRCLLHPTSSDEGTTTAQNGTILIVASAMNTENPKSGLLTGVGASAMNTEDPTSGLLTGVVVDRYCLQGFLEP
jgi:pyridoxal/pyridoxine/pyridoxamine kinase